MVQDGAGGASEAISLIVRVHALSRKGVFGPSTERIIIMIIINKRAKLISLLMKRWTSTDIRRDSSIRKGDLMTYLSSTELFRRRESVGYPRRRGTI